MQTFFGGAQPVSGRKKLYRGGPYYAGALVSSTPAKFRRKEAAPSLSRVPFNRRDDRPR